MTLSPKKKAGIPDVPEIVFENFLQALRETGLSTIMVDRLRNTLLEDRTFTTKALKKAIFDEEQLQ